MKKKLWIYLVFMFVIPGLLLVTSCAKKTVKNDLVQSHEDEEAKLAAEEAKLAAEKAREEELADQELAKQELIKQRSLTEKHRQEETARRKIIADRNLFMNENIYFDFDMFNLKPEAQEVLKRKAEWLRNNPVKSIIIEGHCDER